MMRSESNDALATSLAKPLAGVADTKPVQLSEAASPRIADSARRFARVGADLIGTDLIGADLIDAADIHVDVVSLVGTCIRTFMARFSVQERRAIQRSVSQIVGVRWPVARSAR